MWRHRYFFFAWHFFGVPLRVQQFSVFDLCAARTSICKYIPGPSKGCPMVPTGCQFTNPQGLIGTPWKVLVSIMFTRTENLRSPGLTVENIHTYLSTYLPTYLPTHLHAYIHTYIHTYIHMLIIPIFLLFKHIFRKTSPKQKFPNNSNQSHPK